MVRGLATFAPGETSVRLDGGGGGHPDSAIAPAPVSTVAQPIHLARALREAQASAPSVHLLYPIVEWTVKQRHARDGGDAPVICSRMVSLSISDQTSTIC